MGELPEPTFAECSPRRSRAQWRVLSRAWIAGLVVHVAVLLALVTFVWSPSRPVRIGGIARQQAIGAVVIPGSQPTGTTGPAAARPKPVRPRKVITPEPVGTTGHADADDRHAIGTAPSGGGQQEAIGGATGPVRLGSGQHLGLIKKVDPIYPATLVASGIERLSSMRSFAGTAPWAT
jgi:hypothetical protein